MGVALLVVLFFLYHCSVFHHNSAGPIESLKIRALIALAEVPGSVPSTHTGTGSQ